MNRIVGLFLLLLSLPWLAHAASLESVIGDQIAHSASAGEYSIPLRMRIISMLYPELLQFLVRREIPNFGMGWGLFAICDETSTLIIAPHPSDYDPSVQGKAIVWDLKANKLLRYITEIPSARDVLITPNGKKFITVACDDHASIWDINGDHELHNLGEGEHIALNHDGSKLCTASWNERTFKVWDVESGQRLYQISNALATCPSGCILAVSPDGTKVACGGHCIRIFDLVAGVTLFEIKNQDNVHSLDFSPDGKQLIADISHYEPCHYIHGKGVWSVLTGDQISKECYRSEGISKKRIVGNKRAEYKSIDYRIDRVNILDDATGQLLCSVVARRDALSDHWLVWRDESCKKVYSLDLDMWDVSKMTELQHAIASLSGRQLWLIDAIRKKVELNQKLEAERNQKFVLDINNPKLTQLIEDYGAMPDIIKDILQDYVTFWACE